MIKKIRNWFVINMFILNTAEKMKIRNAEIVEENNRIMSKFLIKNG